MADLMQILRLTKNNFKKIVGEPSFCDVLHFLVGDCNTGSSASMCEQMVIREQMKMFGQFVTHICLYVITSHSF